MHRVLHINGNASADYGVFVAYGNALCSQPAAICYVLLSHRQRNSHKAPHDRQAREPARPPHSDASANCPRSIGA